MFDQYHSVQWTRNYFLRNSHAALKHWQSHFVWSFFASFPQNLCASTSLNLLNAAYLWETPVPLSSSVLIRRLPRMQLRRQIWDQHRLLNFQTSWKVRQIRGVVARPHSSSPTYPTIVSVPAQLRDDAVTGRYTDFQPCRFDFLGVLLREPQRIWIDCFCVALCFEPSLLITRSLVCFHYNKWVRL